MLHIAIGWWVGFLLFPVLLQWRMTPPRGDNWAGCLGAVAGMWVYMQRNSLRGVTQASLIAGFIGGVGFSLATAIQILWLKTGWHTNWHSVLEQTYGLINGIGIGFAMWFVARHAEPVSDTPPMRRWTDWLAPAAVLLLVTYLNARKNPEQWVDTKAFPPMLYWFPPMVWFNIGSVCIAAAVLFVLIRHMSRPVPFLTTSWLGKAQGLYLVFLAAVVVMNFERAVVSFSPERLITEGVILLNACLCLVLTVHWAGAAVPTPLENKEVVPLRRTVAIGIPAAIVCCLLCFGLTMAAFGTRPPGMRKPLLRFGDSSAEVVRHVPSGIRVS